MPSYQMTFTHKELTLRCRGVAVPSESPAASALAAKPAKGLSTGCRSGRLVTRVMGPGSEVRGMDETDVRFELSRSCA